MTTWSVNKNAVKTVQNKSRMVNKWHCFHSFVTEIFIIPIFVFIINLERLIAYITEDISEEKLYPAVLGLACALGLCGVLVFALMGFLFRRGMCEQCLSK